MKSDRTTYGVRYDKKSDRITSLIAQNNTKCVCLRVLCVPGMLRRCVDDSAIKLADLVTC